MSTSHRQEIGAFESLGAIASASSSLNCYSLQQVDLVVEYSSGVSQFARRGNRILLEVP